MASLKHYYGARILRNKKRRTIYFHADLIRVENGDLLLIKKREGGEEELYRALASGTWEDVFLADGFNGDELHEEHDYDEATRKDARDPLGATRPS